MTTNQHEWHQRPAGDTGVCAVCGAPRQVKWEHRAIPDDSSEESGCAFENRRKTASGWTYRRFSFQKKATTTHQYRVKLARERVTRVHKAAALSALGLSNGEIGKRLGVSKEVVSDYRTEFPEVFLESQRDAKKHQEVLFAQIREEAKSDAVFTEEYWQRAKHAARVSAASGQPIFPPNGSDTLTSFFDRYYVPMRLQGAARLTLTTFRVTLRQWELATGNPPLSEITPETLARFQQVVANRRGNDQVRRVSPTVDHLDA
jgi:hypothetical protein